MKKYYNRLTKEEQKNIKKEIKNSEYKTTYKKFNIYLIYTLIALLLIILDIYFRYYYNGKTIDYILDIILLIILTVFYLKVTYMKENYLNKYALSKRKKN